MRVLQERVRGWKYTPLQIEITPDSHWCVCTILMEPVGKWKPGGGTRIFRYDLHTGDSVDLEESHAAKKSALSPDGRFLAAVAIVPRTGAALLRVWNVEENRIAHHLSIDGLGRDSDLAFDGAGTLYATMERGQLPLQSLTMGTDGRLEIGPSIDCQGVEFGDRGPSSIASLGSAIAVGGYRALAVASFESDEGTRVLSSIGSTVRRVCFSPDGRYVAALLTKKVAIFDLTDSNGRPTAETRTSRSQIEDIAITPDNRLLSAGKGALSTWSLADAAQLARLDFDVRLPTAVAVSEDGQVGVVGGVMPNVLVHFDLA